MGKSDLRRTLMTENTIRSRLETMLLELKKEYNISYIKLSRDMGKGQSYIGNILSGAIKEPSDDLYSYLQIRFNANPEWLRTGKGEMFLAGGKVNHYSAASYTQMLYSLPEDERILVQNMLTILMRNHQKSGNANEK